MLRSCCKCGKIHEDSITCKSGRLPATNEQRLRNLNSWHIKRQQIKERSLYLCSVCKDKQEISFDDNLEVHHIIKLRDYPDGLLEDDNLICLCVKHHKQADQGLLTPAYLKELAIKRDSIQDSLI